MLHAVCDLRQSEARIHSRIGEHDVPREGLFLYSAMWVFNLTGVNVNVNICEKVGRQRDIEGDSIVELQ
jgi:hypothetical protein